MFLSCSSCASLCWIRQDNCGDQNSAKPSQGSSPDRVPVPAVRGQVQVEGLGLGWKIPHFWLETLYYRNKKHYTYTM